MRVYQVIGYPKSHYFVSSADWGNITRWMRQNKVDFLQESCGQHGVGFSLYDNADWFLLRWL